MSSTRSYAWHDPRRSFGYKNHSIQKTLWRLQADGGASRHYTISLSIMIRRAVFYRPGKTARARLRFYYYYYYGYYCFALYVYANHLGSDPKIKTTARVRPRWWLDAAVQPLCRGRFHVIVSKGRHRGRDFEMGPPPWCKTIKLNTNAFPVFRRTRYAQVY